ncbi:MULTISPECIES: hypothetical protein [unclassified Novosphingobium]|uniref:hypothetical protein n=1 Tax=unclassified Novosphingobium TaxID=2644732 RepID=UPI000D3131B5|nr:MULTISPECIES: hypothetical protein [unclassified Novosphingobium]PTR06470.1 hypothetical protein C8K11_12083 [Novosphingobium sp. GV055]PUA94889.1 hypothetical protein C8K12_12083 [Novosphingobium sp. GV061]PUB13814.1 hypothetical protein C8K14_12083 [Novosphingobium sp. GV079]PUB38512.1 hypothetical protein C8K10_12083 [Novosphingobium sp. GV027]
MIIPLDLPALSPAALALSVLRKFWRPIVVGAAALLLILYARHEHALAEKRGVEIALWRDAEHNWRRAYTVQRNSFDVLHQALGMQNAKVAALKADSDARVQAGKDANAAIAPAVKSLTDAAAKIRAVPQTSATGCHTNDAVMAFKDQI